jgi:hypothetical protein
MENMADSGGKSLSKLGSGIGNFFKNVVSKVGDGVKSMGKAIGGFLKGIASGIVQAATAIGTGIGTMIAEIGAGVALAVEAITLAITSSVGIGGAVFAVIAALAAEGIYAIIAIAGAVSEIAKATAATAREQRKLGQVNASLAKDSGNVMDNLAKIAETDFSSAIAGMSELVKAANEFSDVDLTARATLENLALITVGKAKDSMTGKVITASKNNIVANVQNVFKDMKMVVKIGENEFEGYVTEIAEKAANQ